MATDSGFRTERDWHLARLLALRPMTFTELHAHVGGESRSFRRRLEQFKTDGFLWFADFGTVSGRGRPSGLWALPPDVADRIRRGLVPNVPPEDEPAELVAPLERLQTWVSVSVRIDRLEAFAELITPGELAAPASFVAQLDGGDRTYLFVFSPSVGAQPAENLILSVVAAGFTASSGTIRHVGPPAAAIGLLRTALQIAHTAVASSPL
jgi:hypothetical protein